MRAWGSRAVLACILLIGCSEVAGNGGDGGARDGSALDGGANGDDASAADDGGASDAGTSDAGTDAGVDAGMSDAGIADAGIADAGIADGGMSDAGMDAGMSDAGTSDAGMDAGTSGDAGTDGGGSDAGTMTTTCPAFVAPPIDWTLPAASGATRFPDVEAMSCPSDSAPIYSLFDIDGDGLDDLVVTSTCGGAGDLGLTHWDVYPSTGGGFEDTPTSWPLPSSGYPGGFHETSVTTCAGAAARYRTFDVDGDARPDLVVTSFCGGASSVGTTHWAVHLNDGSGFEASATSFGLPSGYTGGFHDIEATTCTGTAPRYALLDADGDLDPDLVITSLCDGSGAVGRMRWLVHTNDGSAFASAPTDFDLPSGYRAASFTRLASDACPFGDSPRFATADLDGDRLPDLVVTSLCSGGPIGRMRWDVHLGTPSGFDDAATAWTLPSYAPGTFTTFEGPDASCAPAAQPRYVVRDADGDAMPDLIVTGLCSGASTLGHDAWAVHPNDGAGFGAALAWALPPDFPGADFTDDRTVSCASGDSPRYDVRDMNGDHVLDFVATSRCSGAGTLGSASWSLYAGCASVAPF